MSGSSGRLARPRAGERADSIPGMSGRRLDQGSWASGRPRRDDRAGPMKDRLIGQWAILMEDAQRPIHTLFDQDMRRLQTVLDLIELAAVGHGPISPEHPPGLQGEHRPHVRAGRQGAMQIGHVRRVNGKSAIVPRQPGRQEPIRLRQGRNTREAHLLNQPILQRVKQPFDAALGLRRVGGNQLHAQLSHRPPKLTRGGEVSCSSTVGSAGER